MAVWNLLVNRIKLFYTKNLHYAKDNITIKFKIKYRGFSNAFVN